MSLKMKCPSKWIVAHNEMSRKMQCPTQNGVSLKMKYHLKYNITQIGLSLKKLECHSKWNVLQNGMSL